MNFIDFNIIIIIKGLVSIFIIFNLILNSYAVSNF